MKKKYGHLFKSYNRIPVPLINLGGNITFYGTRITYILVRVPNSRKKVLFEFHSSPIGGHSSFLKTYHGVKKEFSWDGLKTNVQKFMAECLVCQQNKVEKIKTLGLLQLIYIPR